MNIERHIGILFLCMLAVGIASLVVFAIHLPR